MKNQNDDLKINISVNGEDMEKLKECSNQLIRQSEHLKKDIADVESTIKIIEQLEIRLNQF